MKQAQYERLDDVTLRVTQDLAVDSKDWGAPRLSRIFNFEARQLITVYERGGAQEYRIPRGEYSNYETGRSVAVTSSMQVQNFSQLDNAEELGRLHRKLKELGGNPPAIDDLTGEMGKKKSPLRAPGS